MIATKKVYVKKNGKWDLNLSWDDEKYVLQSLAEDLVFKYLIKSKDVKRITHKLVRFTDWEISVYHKNNVKTIYRITK